ncbi:MAG: MGMT family protein [Petrotogales bacterium]
MPNKSLFKQIYNAIELIPEGKVATYGQVGKYVGCSAKFVGYALSSLKNSEVPWHRVINKKGRISIKNLDGYNLQKYLLEKEGITFNEDNSIELNHFLYHFESKEF